MLLVICVQQGSLYEVISFSYQILLANLLHEINVLHSEIADIR